MDIDSVKAWIADKSDIDLVIFSFDKFCGRVICKFFWTWSIWFEVYNFVRIEMDDFRVIGHNYFSAQLGQLRGLMAVISIWYMTSELVNRWLYARFSTSFIVGGSLLSVMKLDFP